MVCSLHSVTTGSRDRANVSLIIIISTIWYVKIKQIRSPDSNRVIMNVLDKQDRQCLVSKPQGYRSNYYFYVRALETSRVHPLEIKSRGEGFND